MRVQCCALAGSASADAHGTTGQVRRPQMLRYERYRTLGSIFCYSRHTLTAIIEPAFLAQKQVKFPITCIYHQYPAPTARRYHNMPCSLGSTAATVAWVREPLSRPLGLYSTVAARSKADRPSSSRRRRRVMIGRTAHSITWPTSLPELSPGRTVRCCLLSANSLLSLLSANGSLMRLPRYNRRSGHTMAAN